MTTYLTDYIQYAKNLVMLHDGKPHHVMSYEEFADECAREDEIDARIWQSHINGLTMEYRRSL